jgi:hypothetical protein
MYVFIRSAIDSLYASPYRAQGEFYGSTEAWEYYVPQTVFINAAVTSYGSMFAAGRRSSK